MKRASSWLLGASLFITPIALAYAQGQAPAAPQTPAPAAGQAPAPGQPAEGRGQRGGGRGPQTPPPPPLTCSSPATATDNKVPDALAKQGFIALFNGKDLTGWQALIDLENGTLRGGAGLNPAELDKLTPADRAAKQKFSNDRYLKHWSVVDGVLIFDGVQPDRLTPHVEFGGQNLQYTTPFDDVEIYVDWCMHQGADSGVYLKNTPQVQMWFNPAGSGGLYNNEPRNNPLTVADNAADQWNTFHIIMQGDDLTTVWLNGKLVVDNVKYANYWDRTKPLPARGHFELQYHGDKLFWKNIYAKPLN